MLDGSMMFLIITHLMRSKEVLTQVGSILEPDDFSNLEKEYSLLWAAAQEWWFENKTPVPKAWLLAILEERLKKDPTFMSEQERTTLFTDVEAIYSLSESELVPHSVLPRLQEFIDQKKSGPMAQQLLSAIPGSDFDAKLSQLCKIHSTTRLSVANKVNLFASGQEYLFSAFDRRPTGVNYVDVLLGGGIVPGEVCGVLGPTGGGKTTTGIQITSESAMSGRRAAYFSYENEVVPAISNRFYGYIGNIPKSVIDGVRTADMLPVAYRKTLDARRDQYQLADMLHIIDMKKHNVGHNGVASIETELRKLQDTNQHIEVLVVDQLLPMVDTWLLHMNKSLDERRVYMQLAVNQLVELARPDHLNCAIFILHQVTTDAKMRRPIARPRLGDASEDRSFDNWLHYCFELGTHDEKYRCWAVTTKAREAAVAEVIVELRGDLYRIEYKPDKFRASQDGFVSTEDIYTLTDQAEIPSPTTYSAANKDIDDSLL
jgi:RecA/RadA recombinase